MNTVQLIGRWTKDVEFRYSASGMAICKGTLAVNRKYKKDETDFINITMFKQTAELAANHTGKGSRIGITGTIQTGSYEGQDGKRVYTTDVIADGIEFLDNKSEGNQRQQNNSRVDEDPFSHSSGPIEVSDEELPF